MHSTIISDTSCLIVFDNINELEIIYKTYGEIITTLEVAEEFGKELPHWIKVERVANFTFQKLLELQLDKGESSAIALAVEKGDDVLLLLDDLRARKYVNRIGIKYTGTLGIINKAKELGIINEIKPILEKLKTTNFRIDDKIIIELLRRNKE